MSIDEHDTAHQARWREEIPHREGELFQGFELFTDYLVASERRGGLARLRVIPWRARDEAHEIAFDEDVFVASIDVNVEPTSRVLRFAYSSLTTPPSIFDYDMTARARTLMKEERVLGDFDRAGYLENRPPHLGAAPSSYPRDLVSLDHEARHGCGRRFHCHRDDQARLPTTEVAT